MNHLQDLRESLPNLIDVDAGREGSERQTFLRSIATSSELAQCFWLGELNCISKLQVIPELMRLPFEVVWLEGYFNEPGRLFGLLAFQRQDGLIDALCFTREQRDWAFLWSMKSLDHDTGNYRLSSTEPIVIRLANQATYVIGGFCTAVNCTNVRRLQHQADPKLQKARARRGKAPLFSYWTLQLVGRSGDSAEFGGSHASPRVHLRRGHPRQYLPGKWTWVQPCAVGNPEAGMVHKDYTMGPTLHGNVRQPRG